MSDIVDSEMGTQFATPVRAQPPRPERPSFLESGPVPPRPNGYYIQPDEPDRDGIYWALVAAAIVTVAVLFWAVGSLFSSSDPETITDDALADLADQPLGDSAASVIDPDAPATQPVIPFADEEPEERAVLTVTTTPAETTSSATALSTTTEAPSTTAAPITEAPTTAAPTTAAPTTAAPTTAAETTTSQATTTTTEATTTQAPATQPASPGNDGAAQQEVLAFTNQARSDNGCPPLSLNSQLNVAADSHSEDMAARGYFDHSSPEGEGPGTRVAEAGYTGRGWGENIAQGYGSASAVVEGWMNSTGHRANILNCEFSELGVGYAEGTTRGNVPGIYWTQVFGIK